MKKKTQEQFIKESIEVHSKKYDYSKVEYINNKVKVTIICPTHGEFKQSPTHHLKGQGCKSCSVIETHNKQRLTNTNFIKKAKKVHGNKYDYSLTEHVRLGDKVTIICPIHGEFEQTSGNHLSGKGCKYCGGTSKMDTKLFIEKAKKVHGDKFDYSKVIYFDSRTKVVITCPIHGDFEQTPNNHLSKSNGCYKCLNTCYDTESFTTKAKMIHNNKYDYTKVDFKNSRTKVIITCPIHGDFEQIPTSHINGYGCYKCGNNLSKNEINILEYIKGLGFNPIHKDRGLLKNKEIDILIPELKIAIEYNGLYWHSEEYLDLEYHLTKTELCESLGYRLIHIFEDEWLFKQEIVKSRLNNVLGVSKKIPARKCIIKYVDNKTKKEFLEKNHIQGSSKSKVDIGLFFGDELVSIMTFGKRPVLNKHEWELIRFCNKLNVSIVGGASKLFKFFIKNHKPNEIVSYADRRWSEGNLYKKLDFSHIHNTKPNYFYVINKKRENRFKYQKHKLVKDGYDENMSEHEIMLSRGIYRVYDSGNMKFIYKSE
jgi:hypothetical protein